MLFLDTFGLFILEKPERSARPNSMKPKEKTIAVTGIPGKKL